MLVMFLLLIILHKYTIKIDKFIGDSPTGDEEEANKNNSHIIGKDGIVPSLPHCSNFNGINGNKCGQYSYPDCCDYISENEGKCYANFSKTLLYYYDKKQKKYRRRTNDELCSSDFKSLPDINNYEKYVYNPNFQLTQEDPSKQTKIDRDIIDTLIFSPQDADALNKKRFYRMRTMDTLGYKKGSKNISITNKYLGFYKQYAMNLLLGHGKECSIKDTSKCVPLGINRWQKIGKCPNDESKYSTSYVDVQNKYINNALGKLIPGKGITSEILKDITRFNPIDMGTNIIGAVSNTPCLNTDFDDTVSSSSSGGYKKKSNNYLQYATDNFPGKVLL